MSPEPSAPSSTACAASSTAPPSPDSARLTRSRNSTGSDEASRMKPPFATMFVAFSSCSVVKSAAAASTSASVIPAPPGLARRIKSVNATLARSLTAALAAVALPFSSLALLDQDFAAFWAKVEVAIKQSPHTICGIAFSEHAPHCGHLYVAQECLRLIDAVLV